MKKTLLLLFAALATLVASAQTKVEIDGIWYNLVSKGKAAEVTYKGSYESEYNEYSGTITIPATVTYDGVEYSVTTIGYSAFSGCSGLTSITIPESVKSIGFWAFLACSSLTSINIPEGVTSIEGAAFYDCSSLNAVHISSIENWCKISFAYSSSNPLYYAHNLYLNGELVTEVIIPEGVTSIGFAAFEGCSSLTSITIPESVSSIGEEAFYGCSSLTSIIVAEGNQVYDSREGCNAIIETSSNTLIQGCSATIIPEGVTNIGNSAFYDCNSLTSITIPEGVTNIGNSAFYDCSSLASITIPEGVTNIGNYAFYGCSSLAAINIPEDVTSIGERAFSSCSSLISITIPESVKSIGNSAFYGCSSLTTVVLLGSVKNIYNEAFGKCSELLDVYCYAESVPSASSVTFNGSYPEYATLHVPTSALESYKSTEPWSSFGTIVTVDTPLTRITLSEKTVTLTEGETASLTITTTPDDADRKLISWSSNNPSVATVDKTGKVTAIAPGTATITATANDGSGVSASCEVTVTPASYVITFLVDGEVILTDTLTRGSTINLPDVPEKEGYTFSGWSEVPETMPAKDVTISGIFIANKYLVTFKIDDEVIIADSLEYGTAIVAPEAPEKEGYTFSGWGEVAGNVPAYDLTYEGSYSINSYTLTYVVDGEAVLTLPIVYGATIPLLKVPAKEGYTFSGWGEVPAVMPAKNVTIEGTFTQLPSIYLTINQADNGCVKQHLVVGIVCAYTIEAAEGWKIHSVTFNGEDVTSQLTEEGTFTTPELQDDATLNIAYEKIDDAIAAATASRIKVQGHQGTLRITGTTEGDDISVYTTDGMLVAQESAEDGETLLTLPTGQVYIVTVADMVVKIGM